MLHWLFLVVYFLAVVGAFVFFAVVLWRAMRAHESIAESMKIIAGQTGKKSQA